MEKIVFFELIDAAYDALVDKYLKNDFIIYFFKTDKKFIKRAKIKQCIKSEKLLDASGIIFKYELYRQASFLAHENVDAIFEKYFSSSPSIKYMQKLLDCPYIVNMYKKELLLYLEKLYEIELKINDISSSKGANDIHFIPRRDLFIHTDDSSPLRDNVEIINYTNVRNQVNNVLRRAKLSILLLYPGYLFFKKIKNISDNKCVKQFKVGITIEKHPKSIFLMNFLTEAFYIHEKEFPKEDVLFIDENSQINLKEYKRREMRYTNLMDDREVISTELFWEKIVKCFFPTWLKTMYFSVSDEPLIINTNRMILSDYILWNIFADNYKINNYARRMLPDNLSKLHILSQCGIETWFIFPDNSSTAFHLDWNESKKNQTLHSFMYYDNAIIYGNIVERYFKIHRNFIKRYIKNGVFFSQIVYKLREGKSKSCLPSFLEQKHFPKRIIGVFDTTYADFGPLKINDGIRFGEDILKLLKDFPDIGIVFKTMKEPELTPYLNPIYDTLRNHERCVLFYRYDRDGVSSPEVIAVSDVVISAAYTSPSAEALGAKKKAIYYDVAGHEIGDKYYYNRYPSFVAHNYEELKKLINYWLNEVTDREFEDFLNTYVKDEIDHYLDGRALTRMRKLLMGSEHSGQHELRPLRKDQLHESGG